MRAFTPAIFPMRNSLESYLDSADGAGKVVEHAKRLMRLAHIYQQLAPVHLSQSSTLANYKSGTVVIHASSGAVATKLRQLAPTLAEAFRKHGIECNGVQIKVQTENPHTPTITSTQKPISAKTGQTLEELRDKLPESPLRTALTQLLDHAAREE